MRTESEAKLVEQAYWRTARKVWRCAGRTYVNGCAQRGADGKFLRCPHMIQKGERCVEYLGESPHYESGPHYCIECFGAEGLIA